MNFLFSMAAAKFIYNPPLSLLKADQDSSAELPKLKFYSQNKVDWECCQHKSLSIPLLSLPILCGHWSNNSSSNTWLKGRCLRKPPLIDFGVAIKARLLGHHKAFSGRNLQYRECKAPQYPIPLVQAKVSGGLLWVTTLSKLALTSTCFLELSWLLLRLLEKSVHGA